MKIADINFDNDLCEIEKIIDQMMSTQLALKQENKFLKKRVVEMSKSRATFVEKNRIAQHQVKRIIQQLQEGTKWQTLQ